MPTVADFYHCFTSETGCCFSLTALNENQLQTSMCAVRMCLCVCFSPRLCGKNLTPIPYQQTTRHFLSPSLLPHYVLFTPLEAARLPPFFLLFHRPTLTWLQYVSLHPTAVFIIPASPCIPFRESLFCLERQTVTSKAPPTSTPDGSQSFHMYQSDATHTKCKAIQLHKILCYKNIIITLSRTLSPGGMLRHRKTHVWEVVQREQRSI